MKLKLMIAGLTAACSLGGTAQAGCLGGAVVGGVAGHFAGHHPILGAAAGCAIGHYASRHRHYRTRGYGHY